MVNQCRNGVRLLLATALAGSCFSLSTLAADGDTRSPKAGGSAAATPETGKKGPYRPDSVPNHARNYYLAMWGVDDLRMQQTASGNLIRFSYRVVDPALAKPLAKKDSTPYLFGRRSRAVLQIPIMDKVGQLRQTGTAKAGQEFWMVFSNKGNLVQPGDRVDVKIGSFHADGLVVK